MEIIVFKDFFIAAEKEIFLTSFVEPLQYHICKHEIEEGLK